jgi:hypothetical protein
MSIFRRKVPSHFIPIHSANVANNDWVIILEAGTIVGPATDRIRVARATQERTIVRRRNIFLRVQRYLVVEGFNPRIHAVYFCPQLYRHDSGGGLAPLQGEEIGAMIAQSVESGLADQRPWYAPSEPLPEQRVVVKPTRMEFDTVVVEMPNARTTAAAG